MNHSPTAQLALLALKHIDTVPVFARYPILEAAADLVGDETIADCCRAQAVCIRQAELHQLKMSGLLELPR